MPSVVCTFLLLDILFYLGQENRACLPFLWINLMFVLLLVLPAFLGMSAVLYRWFWPSNRVPLCTLPRFRSGGNTKAIFLLSLTLRSDFLWVLLTLCPCMTTKTLRMPQNHFQFNSIKRKFMESSSMEL